MASSPDTTPGKTGLSSSRSAPLLEDGSQLTRYRRAAMCIHTAINGKFVKRGPRSSRIWPVYINFFKWDNYGQVAVGLLLLLSLFEVPLWCNETGFWLAESSVERCAVPGKAVNASDAENPLFMSGVPLVPIGIGMIIEVVLWLVCCRRLQLMNRLNRLYKEDGLKANFSDNFRRQSIICAIGIVDVIIYLAKSGSSDYRLAPFARFALGALSIRPVRKAVVIFFQIVTELKQIACFVIGSVLIFAWMTTMIFNDVTEKDQFGDDVSTGLGTFGESLYTAFVTVTTANLPDALVFTYSYKRIFIVIWLPFIIVSCCVFVQVVLAVVYNAYGDKLGESLKATFVGRAEAIKRAYRYLRGENENVSHEDFKLFIQELQPLIYVDLHLVDIIFEGIDDDNSGFLSNDEFVDVCEVIQMNYQLTTRDSVLRKCVPACVTNMMQNQKDGDNLGYDFRYEGCSFCWLMDQILWCNVLFMIVESVFDFSPDLTEPDSFQHIDLFFSFVYILEVVFKLMIWSWAEYWTNADNQFDFISTFFLAASGGSFMLGYINNDTLRYINLLRILRLLKALGNIDQFRGVMDTIIHMVQTCRDVLVMNALVIYLFAALGQQLFGGELYKSNPKLAAAQAVQPLDYFDSHFQVFNFNDMFLGGVTLFFVLLTGWVDQVSAATIALYPALSGRWFVAMGFNIGFYFASVLLAFNVFAAFSIDVYCKLKELSDAEEAGDKDESQHALETNLDDIQAKLWAEGQQLHVWMSSEVQRMRVYKSMFADALEDGDDKGENQ